MIVDGVGNDLKEGVKNNTTKWRNVKNIEANYFCYVVPCDMLGELVMMMRNCALIGMKAGTGILGSRMGLDGVIAWLIRYSDVGSLAFSPGASKMFIEKLGTRRWSEIREVLKKKKLLADINPNDDQLLSALIDIEDQVGGNFSLKLHEDYAFALAIKRDCGFDVELGLWSEDDIGNPTVGGISVFYPQWP